MFRIIVNYIKINRLLRKIYKNERIEKNLSQIFGVPCKQDWVGRLYMVVNPILQDIEEGGNKIIYDQNNSAQIEAWVMKNLEMIRNFVVNNSMFDLLTYSIDRIDDDENYLIVFKNIYFDDMKKICIGFGAGAILIGIACLVLLCCGVF